MDDNSCVISGRPFEKDFFERRLPLAQKITALLALNAVTVEELPSFLRMLNELALKNTVINL